MFKTDAILTERESEVVLGYARQLNGKEIADECCMAYRTVVNHTQNAFEKAGCKRSIHALVSWWYQTNFSIDIRQIIAAILLLILLPFELFGDSGEFRRAKDGRELMAKHAVRPRRRTQKESNLLDYA